jgi:hypothetical protein
MRSVNAIDLHSNQPEFSLADQPFWCARKKIDFPRREREKIAARGGKRLLNN